VSSVGGGVALHYPQQTTGSTATLTVRTTIQHQYNNVKKNRLNQAIETYDKTLF